MGRCVLVSHASTIDRHQVRLPCSIMENGSTPHVGVTRKNMAAIH